MQAYIYQAALLCEECATATIQQMRDQGTYSPNAEDSGYQPQGPYSNGGGEADSPQHCDSCGLFLENPLTNDGVDYVREQIGNSAPSSVARDIWQPFYVL